MALFEDDFENNEAINLPGTTSGTLDGISDINDLGSEAVEEEVEKEPVPTAPTKPLNSRYAGKSQDELAQMLEDAQAHIGRQSSEIGEVRKLADELVKKSLGTPKAPPVEEEHEDDFFIDPQAAVARAVSKHPAVAAAKEAAETAARERSTSRILASHPDMTQVIGSPEFATWVKASPMRVRMYALADQYDVEAAEELLSNFKDSKAYTPPTPASTPSSAAKAAATLAAGSVGTSSTGSTAPPAKKYRRSDIMRLMSTDPARYDAMADEILKAYAEGRVV